MFDRLKEINIRPRPFQEYTAEELWTNQHTSKKMLEYHLDDSVDAASRNRPFINRSVDWIVTQFGVTNETAIADFGCGPGLYTTLLAEQGARVTGVDFSKNSLEYAKRMTQKRGLKIKYGLKNYLDFETTDSFDLIIMIVRDFCSLSPEQRAKLFSKFKSPLKPRGSILLEVYSLNYLNHKEETSICEFNQLNRFWSPEDYHCFVNTFKYDEEKTMHDKYTIIEKLRTREVYNGQQCFSKDSLTKEFAQNDLKVKECYSDVSGKKFDLELIEFAVVAKVH